MSLALRAAISLGLLYFALLGVNTAVLGARLADLRPAWLAVGIMLAFVQLALLAPRWRRIAQACGAELPLGRAFKLGLIAAFFNQVLPSTVGGDAMRIWLFARQGQGWARATHSVLLDRFIGLLALAILVVICLPWSLTLVQNPIGRTALLAIGFGSISAAFAFIALGYQQWDLLQRLAPLRHLHQMSGIARQVLSRPADAGFVVGLSLVIHVMTAGIAWCAAQAVDAPISFFHALVLVPPVLLISTVPISIAGWGVREKSLVLAFAYAGLSESNGFLVSVLLGATMVAIGLVGGIVWLTSSDRAKPDDAPLKS
jgi:glycosyltransferase 2 family protein